MVARHRRKPAKLRSIKLDELSLVDRPANPHAVVTLFKSARERSRDRASRSCAEVVKDAVREVQALSFDDVLVEDQAREAAAQVQDNVWSRWSALQRSFETICYDEELAPEAKVTAMRESLTQFVDSLGEAAEAVTKSLTAVPALAELLTEDGNSSEGDGPMTAAEKKMLDELNTQVERLTKQLEAATGDDAAKKAADLQAQLDEATAKADKLAKSLEGAEAEKTEAVAKSKMTDTEKEFMATLDKEGQARFMGMKPEERKREMKKAETDDPVVYKSEASGEEFRKSDDPRLVAMAKQRDEDRKLITEEREKRETAEMTKRAEDELGDFSGELGDKVEVLRSVSKMDEAPRKTLLGMLQAGGKAIKAAFDTVGHKGGSEDLAKAAEAFEKRVTEVASRDKVSRKAALETAAREFPQEFEAYQNGGN